MSTTLRPLTLLTGMLLVAGMTSACGASIAERRAWIMPKYGGELYKAPCPTVIEAGKKALDACSLNLEAEEPIYDNMYALYAEAGPFLLRQGEVVRVVFRPVDDGCRVQVIARPKMAGNVLKKGTAEYALEYNLALKGHLAETAMQDKYGSMEDENEFEEESPAQDATPTGGEVAP